VFILAWNVVAFAMFLYSLLLFAICPFYISSLFRLMQKGFHLPTACSATSSSDQVRHVRTAVMALTS